VGNLARRVFWLTFVLFCIPLHGEVIKLKNGNQITGKLTGINGDTFVVKTDYGEIQVPRSDVVSINFPDNETKSADASSRPEVIDETLTNSTYVNRTASFQLTVPKGWRIAPELRQAPGTVAGLMSEDQTLFLVVTSEAFKGTLSTYQVLAETKYKMNFSNYEKLEEAPGTLDGRSGVRTIFHGDVKTGPSLKFLDYILPYDGKMVRVTLFTLEPLFGDAMPVFEKIAASYQSLPGR
jgi:hypothetical protein